MKRSLTLLAATILVVLASSFSAVAIDHGFGTMNYQGIIKDGDGVKVSGIHTISFRIWDDSLGGSQWWSENHTRDIIDGTVCIVLGSINSLASLDWSKQYWIELQILGDNDPMPRIRLTSVPYALNAKMMSGFSPGNLSGQVPVNNGILNINLNADKLDGADRTTFIEEGESNSITNSMIVGGSVTSEEIADGTISLQDIHQNGATPGRIIKWTGSAWMIGDDDIGGAQCGTVLECTSNDPPLTAIQHGQGEAIRIEHRNPNVYGPALYVSTLHRGTAGRFVVNLTTNENYAVYALTKGLGNAVYAESWGADGVYGKTSAPGASGVYGYNSNEQGYGVSGWSDQGIAVYGNSPGWAGYFDGDVYVAGSLLGGNNAFRIDHPLDPENKLLVHSSIASPDMKNVYDGVVELDATGCATVELPEYFEALNKDFRYQLTCIGGFAPIYISEEIHAKMFKISGGEPGLRVSWQVTGIRKDAFAETNRSEAELEKGADDQGFYAHPEAYGLSDDKRIGFNGPDANSGQIGGN